MKTPYIYKISQFNGIALFLIFFLCLSSLAQTSEENFEGIKIISANIRVALKTDVEKGRGWDKRKDLVFQVIKDQNPDIICLQEVMKVQNEDFKKDFPGFFSFGFEGPEMDAYTDGEYHLIAKNPILFNTTKYEFITGGTYWLSEQPHLGGSMAWETARARHVNWVRLKEKASGKVFRVLNTHFDHVSGEAKQKAAEMILEESDQYPENFPQILAGDFNSDVTSSPIQTLRTQWEESYAVLHNEVDPGFTVHGFIGPKAKTKKGKVDFIFYRGQIAAKTAAVVRDHKDGVYPSDHYFVTTRLQLK